MLLAAATPAVAQTPLSVDAAEAQKHLVKHVDPVYPAIAKAAQVQGDVVLKIDIGKDGKVTKVQPVNGPPMLLPAATDAVKQWQYKPFEKDGVPAAANTTVTVPFSLGVAADPKDEETAKAFFPLFHQCVELMSKEDADPEEQAQACQRAADEADKFSKNSRYIERRNAYTYYTSALVRNGQAAEAVPVGEKAIAVVLQGHDDDSGASVAYGLTAKAKAASGDMEGADKDLETAEGYQRKAMATPDGQERKQMYSLALKGLLTYHAQVLDALGRQAESTAKQQEADKL